MFSLYIRHNFCLKCVGKWTVGQGKPTSIECRKVIPEMRWEMDSTLPLSLPFVWPKYNEREEMKAESGLSLDRSRGIGKTITKCNIFLEKAQAAAAAATETSTSQAAANGNEHQPMEVEVDGEKQKAQAAAKASTDFFFISFY
ncbi:unnamed protein product [Microthlaspi erraticum]|uniref:Zinc finger C3HC4 RING-type domain-containing protein n=1 Tax=Microthlaspi erraticum TaxID=1685480 RepID=A0A6D2KG78_9BRAS|nr:unnamed protein product [Microthlaspi erraticum]